MPDCFEILHKDLAGRIGKLSTPHGTVETPALMPVVNPHLQLIPPPELRDMGATMLITNSYIIRQDEALRVQALEKGLHNLLDFQGPIMTDSGAFQLSVYGNIDVLPLEILDFQFAIQSDICVPLDIPTPPDVTRERAASELKETERRLEEALKNKGASLLAGPIQGSTYPDLREAAAHFLRDKGFDVYPVGGVVPLMETYRFSDLVDVVTCSKKGIGLGRASPPVRSWPSYGLRPGRCHGMRPLRLCGLRPLCQGGKIPDVTGTWRLEEMRYLPCSCPVCQDHDQEELMKSPERVKLLAKHNLYISLQEINLVKQCIREGSLWELLETRCRSHPRILDGFENLVKRANGWRAWTPPPSPLSLPQLGIGISARGGPIRLQDRKADPLRKHPDHRRYKGRSGWV